MADIAAIFPINIYLINDRTSRHIDEVPILREMGHIPAVGNVIVLSEVEEGLDGDVQKKRVFEVKKVEHHLSTTDYTVVEHRVFLRVDEAQKPFVYDE